MSRQITEGEFRRILRSGVHRVLSTIVDSVQTTYYYSKLGLMCYAERPTRLQSRWFDARGVS